LVFRLWYAVLGAVEAILQSDVPPLILNQFLKN
jgi:hypothetical protein